MGYVKIKVTDYKQLPDEPYKNILCKKLKMKYIKDSNFCGPHK